MSEIFGFLASGRGRSLLGLLNVHVGLGVDCGFCVVRVVDFGLVGLVLVEL